MQVSELYFRDSGPLGPFKPRSNASIVANDLTDADSWLGTECSCKKTEPHLHCQSETDWLAMETSAIVAMALLLVILWSIIGCCYFWFDCWLTSEFPCQKRFPTCAHSEYSKASLKAYRLPTFYKRGAPGRPLISNDWDTTPINGQPVTDRSATGEFRNECYFEKDIPTTFAGRTWPKFTYGEKLLYEEI